MVPFFEGLGFKLPPRKGVADFLQEVTSRKDQAQYWADPARPYRFITVPEMVEAFTRSPVGQQLEAKLQQPIDMARPPKNTLWMHAPSLTNVLGGAGKGVWGGCRGTWLC